MGNCECCTSDAKATDMVQVIPTDGRAADGAVHKVSGNDAVSSNDFLDDDVLAICSERPAAQAPAAGEPTPSSDVVMPSQEAVTQSHVSIEFESRDGLSRTTVFQRQPLGMDFERDKMPIEIVSCKGHAEALGVKAGWIMRSIDNQPLDALTFLQSADLLMQRVSKLPLPTTPIALAHGLPIEFVCPDGSSRSITFLKMPLGMYFEKAKMPIELTATNGHSDELGVQKGWKMKALDGQDLADFDFSKVMELFRRKLSDALNEAIVD